MGFSPFPNEMYFRILDTNGEINGGSFTFTEIIDLRHFQTCIIMRGAISGSEQLRVNLYGSANFETPIYSSDWLSLSDIGAYANSWVGDVYFDFTSAPLNPNLTYYVGVQAQNYTRAGDDSFYVGVRLDWPEAVNTQTGINAGIKMLLLGMKEP